MTIRKIYIHISGGSLGRGCNSLNSMSSISLSKGEANCQDCTFYLHTHVQIPFTVRPRDTRPQAARTSQVHVFELGPKIFEMNEFM